jgi:Holliday junction resolvase-like predicted endonuclease
MPDQYTRTPRFCAYCQSPIPQDAHWRTIYCSPLCNSRSRNARYGNTPQYVVTPATQGAITELIVSVDLMKRGFDLYRATSPACPCDLVAIRNGVVTRVEVKTGIRRLNGEIRPVKLSERQRRASDVVAYVAHDGEILYAPELPDA